MKTMKETNETYPAAAHLSEKALKLWSDIVPNRARSPERLALLQVALECLDRADGCREQIQREGLTVISTTTGVQHINVIVKIEKESRAQFAKIWSDLSLQWNATIDGRSI